MVPLAVLSASCNTQASASGYDVISICDVDDSTNGIT